MKLDDDRFIDFSDSTCILQRRYDDKTKRRTVKREDVTPKAKKAAASKKRKVSDDDASGSESEDDKEKVKWVWAGDSKKGSQDVWIEYDADIAEKIENAYKRGKKKVVIDTERFIDLSDPTEFLQRRKDDESKRRVVKRLTKSSKASTTTASHHGGAGGIEIVFSFDTTGSMMGALQEVRNKVTDIVKRLLQDLPTIRIGVIAHGDYCDVHNLLQMIDLTTDEKALCNFINSAPATGGGDAPEAYEWVLYKAQSMDWSAGASKTLVVLGDAAPHPPAQAFSQMKNFKLKNPRKTDWKEEVDNLSAMGVKIHGVRCGSSKEPFYSKIAESTGGKYVDLDQFDVVSDMLLAMCFKEGGEHMLENYRLEVASSGRMDARMAAMFASLKEKS
eukprot:Phypoly_transcript_09115.p1 GENE.Phypoly_transcript_09115~~Phypoly_transcript_09115.p1  ORF type:complete len:446 (+),score=106.74 Phypoly_transcript_09115:176-1339(+)